MEWRLSGADAAEFTIHGAALSFLSPPDHEMPADRDRNSAYDLVVEAFDGNLTGSFAVAVLVTDVDETPVVSGDSELVVDEHTSGTIARYAVVETASVMWNWEIWSRSG
ncbi:hypothetical protein [Candidatus Poriferisodalis sp.]|uniref:hypothetical protein n=1 Tax=Candidatus Poriferisodalis sp. TaxID=3101277 RepID=UPI003B5BCF49